MTELESQVLLEAMPDGVFLWSARDVARYRKGTLQRAIARKLKQESEVPA